MTRRLSPLIVALGIIGAFILTPVLHEPAHLTAALIFGIPINGFFWIDPNLRVPTVYLGVTEWSWQLTLTLYSGGVFAGTFWGAIYFLLYRRRRFESSGAWWAFGAWLSVLVVWQLGQGLMEGSLNGLYLDGINQVFSTSRLMQISFMIMGFLFHVTFTRHTLHRWGKTSGAEDPLG